MTGFRRGFAACCGMEVRLTLGRYKTKALGVFLSTLARLMNRSAALVKRELVRAMSQRSSLVTVARAGLVSSVRMRGRRTNLGSSDCNRYDPVTVACNSCRRMSPLRAGAGWAERLDAASSMAGCLSGAVPDLTAVRERWSSCNALGSQTVDLRCNFDCMSRRRLDARRLPQNLIYGSSHRDMRVRPCALVRQRRYAQAKAVKAKTLKPVLPRDNTYASYLSSNKADRPGRK